MNALHARPPGHSANIFINYRREDSAGHAGRLYDGLSSHFSGRLFMDVDNIAPGVDFGDAIKQAVGSCEVLIVVIGREWLTVSDTTGHRRLDNAGDFVRLEVEAALARDIRVIPVLVQDTSMPRAEDLPPSLAPLARHNAIELSDVRWAFDVDRLGQAILEILQETPEQPPGPARPQAWMFLLAALVLVSAGWAISIWKRPDNGNRPASPVAVPASPAAVTASPTPPAVLTSLTSALAAPNLTPAKPQSDIRPVEQKPSGSTMEPEGETLPVLRARITTPRQEDEVGKCMRVKGVVSGLGAGQRAFLCIQNPGEEIYPEGEIFPSTEGKWSMEATTSRSDFDLFVVISSSPEAARVLNDRSNPERTLRDLPAGAAIASPRVRLRRQGKVADFLTARCVQRRDSGS
jgi:hypothetical protein